MIYDERFRRVRVGRCLVLPRIRGADWEVDLDQARTYQQEYFSDQSNSFAIPVDTRREQWDGLKLWAMVWVTISFLPCVFLGAFFQNGFGDVPDNEPGEIYRNSMVIFAFCMAAILLFGALHSAVGLVRWVRTKRVVAAHQWGIVLADNDGKEIEAPWGSLSYPKKGYLVEVQGADSMLMIPRLVPARRLILHNLPPVPKKIIVRYLLVMGVAFFVLVVFAAVWLDYMDGGENQLLLARSIALIFVLMVIMVPGALLVLFNFLSRTKASTPDGQE